jgi:acyl-CoA reductase-like NAD-dependent aldehyde dehydrogenase
VVLGLLDKAHRAVFELFKERDELLNRVADLENRHLADLYTMAMSDDDKPE